MAPSWGAAWVGDLAKKGRQRLHLSGADGNDNTILRAGRNLLCLGPRRFARSGEVCTKSSRDRASVAVFRNSDELVQQVSGCPYGPLVLRRRCWGLVESVLAIPKRWDVPGAGPSSLRRRKDPGDSRRVVAGGLGRPVSARSERATPAKAAVWRQRCRLRPRGLRGF